MIDFAALALAPGITAFARPVMIQPARSQPGEAAYPARGVWSSRQVEVQTEDGRILNTRVITLGIMLSEFPVAPKTRDHVDVPAAGFYTAEGRHWIEDIDLDGQGGASLTLKKGDAPRSGTA